MKLSVFFGRLGGMLVYIIDGVCVCLFVRHKILRIRPKGLCGDHRALRCRLNAGTSACADRRPAYMLVSLIGGQFSQFSQLFVMFCSLLVSHFNTPRDVITSENTKLTFDCSL